MSEARPEWPPELSPGVVTTVADGIRRVVAPNPGIMTGPGTNSYLVGGDRVAVIDPGPDDDAHLAALLEAGGDRIGWILVTHSHVDHSPLAVRLAAATGAPIVGFARSPSFRPGGAAGPRHPEHGTGAGPHAAGAEHGAGPEPGGGPGPHGAGPEHGPAAGGGRPAGGLDPHDTTFDPDRRMADGERIDLGDCAVEAVYTPGHASNHLCFELAGTGLLFSGDHVMSGSTVVIAPPDGDMAVYMESLEKVKARRPRRIAPGHGAVIDDPGAVLDSYLRHRLDREAQVLAALGSAGPEGVGIEALVSGIYLDVPAALHPVARYSVWAHLRKLSAEGRATTPDPDDIDAPWRRAINPPVGGVGATDGE